MTWGRGNSGELSWMETLTAEVSTLSNRTNHSIGSIWLIHTQYQDCPLFRREIVVWTDAILQDLYCCLLSSPSYVSILSRQSSKWEATVCTWEGKKQRFPFIISSYPFLVYLRVILTLNCRDQLPIWSICCTPGVSRHVRRTTSTFHLYPGSFPVWLPSSFQSCRLSNQHRTLKSDTF